jgi:hypothetical protein
MSHESVETKVEELLEGHDRFGRAIVVAIVVTTLVATLTAFLQTRALRAHDESLDLADQWGALASQVSFRWDAAALLQLDRYRLAENARVRSEQATAATFLGVGPPRAESTLDAKRWHVLSVRLQQESGTLAAASRTEFADIRKQTQGSLPSVGEAVAAGKEGTCRAPAWARAPAPGVIRDDRSRAGPDQDPNFPTRYLADNRRETYLLEARRDGASMEAESAERQFTRYAVALTLFAVSVFLLGFSLSPYGKPHRHLFATVAGVFVVGSTVWCVYAAVRGPHAGNAESAAAYADGRVSLDRGTYRDDLQAIYYFNCAIKLEPGFTQAYVDRGMAYSALTDPNDPTASGNVELMPPRYQEHSLRDLSTAQKLGAIDPTLPAGEGAFVFERGLEHHNAADMRRGLRLEQETARTFPRDPTWAMNVAEGELVLGYPWRPAYHRAEALARAQANAESVGTDSFVAGALTDLADIVTKTRPTSASLMQQITLAREDVVDQLSDSQGASPRAVQVNGLKIHTIDIQPSYAEFSLDTGTDFTRNDQLYAAWYYRLPHRRIWSAFALLTGPATPYRDAHGRWSVITPFQYGSYGPQCLPSGAYKLELYVNGRLATARRVERHVTGHLESSAVQDMNLQVCRPKAWGRLPTRSPGLADGYVSPDRRSGLLIFDVSAEADAARAGKHTLPLLHKALVQFRDLMPNDLRPGGPFVSPFLGASRNRKVVHDLYPGGELYAAIAVTGSGRAVVGVVFGPRRMFVHPVDRHTRATMAENLLAGMITSEYTY